LVEHFAVQEEERVEGLILGGGSDVLVNSQVGEEGFNFWYAHLFGMSFIVEEDKVLDPGDISFFCTDGIVFTANGIAHLVQEFPGAFFGGTGS